MGRDIQSLWTETGALNILLSPLAGLYAGGWLAYRSAYGLGLKKPYRASIPIITVGNLRVGGSGKTPMTIFLANLLAEMGRSVVIGLSGYGSPRQENASLAPGGSLVPAEWGDEPALMRETFPDTPLIVGRDRVAAAMIAETEFADRTLVMDDGFQHLRLYQPLSILIDDPDPRNRLCLPAGPYREPRESGRRRAKLVLPNGFQIIRNDIPVRLLEGSELSRDEPVSVVTAIARPELLLASLTEHGYRLNIQQRLRDHDPMDSPELFAEIPEGSTIIVTRKDWVKLRDRADVGRWQFGIADYEVSVEPRKDFRDWLARRLDETVA